MSDSLFMPGPEANAAPAAPDNTPKALKVPAQIITYLFHPVFIPLAMAWVLMKLTPVSFAGTPPKQQGLWLISIAVTTMFFPMFSVGLMKPLGFISSYKMPSAKDRVIPLITSMIFYFWINHVFNNLPGVPFIYKTFFLGNFLGLIAVFMVTIFSKVSMHTAGTGSVIGILLVLMMTSNVNLIFPLFAALIIAGLVGTARMLLHSHTKGQIYMGYFLGIAAQLGAYWYLKP